MAYRSLYKRLILAAVAAILVIAVIASASSFAWYREIPSDFGDAKIEGVIRADYFERGTGTEGDPFIIHTPIHFYNFAWLQYLGYFNDAVVYFELCDDGDDGCITGDCSGVSADPDTGVPTLDMAGMTLPPVGTSEFPFIGHFNGNGIAITDLIVSNSAQPEDFNDFPIRSGRTTKKDGSLAQWTPNDDSAAAGVFGYVGGYGGTETPENTGIENLYLNNITVSTTTTGTVAGIVAGYVNAPISGVGVSNSQIAVGSGVGVTALSDYISDYALIGHCEDEYIGYASIVEKTLAVGEPELMPVTTGNGEGDQWGGSINMLNLYNRLLAVQTAASNTNIYASQVIRTIDETAVGGPQVIDEQFTYTNTTYSRAFKNFINPSVPSAGSFSFGAFGSNNFSEQYLYLYGQDDSNFTQTQTTITLTSDFDPAYLIGGDGHYLNRTAAHAVSASATANSAQKWAYESAAGDKYRLYYYDAGEKYYLNNSGETLIIAKNAGTTEWTVDELAGTISTSFDDRDYYIAYDNFSSGWKLIPALSYRIISNSQVLTATANGAISTGGTGNPRWYFTGTVSSPGYVYTVINNTRYYLTRNGNTVSLQTQTANRTTWYVSDGTFYCVDGGLNYYLTYESGWQLRTIIKHKIGYNNNYLSISDGAVISQNNENATMWTFSSTDGAPSGTISATTGGNTYFLDGDADGLSLSTSGGVRWVNDNGQLYYVVTSAQHPDVRYYLVYDAQDGWCAKPLKYWLSSGGNYLSTNGSNVVNLTNQNTATQWIFSTIGSPPSGYLSDGTNYLRIVSSGGFMGIGASYSLELGPTQATWVTTDRQMRTTSYNNRYIRYNNGWIVSNNKNNATTLTFTPTITPQTMSITSANTDILEAPQTALTPFTENITPGLEETELQVQTREVENNCPANYPYDTWFPLSVQSKDTYDENGNLTASATYNANNSSIAVDGSSNTGYVISGSAYRNTTTAWPYKHGDIRVSRYAMSNLSVALGTTSYNNNGRNLEVLTVTPYTAALKASGANSYLVHRISDTYNQSNLNTSVNSSLRPFTKTPASDLGLTKYNDLIGNDNSVVALGARSNLHNVFQGKSDVYGLHFMDAAISKNDYVVAPVVEINGRTYYDYKLPRHCIDFNLKEDGKITFFAGTYFSGNTCFFSLHEIKRDANQDIESIKEIEIVYQRGEGYNAEYYYKYRDGSYSDGYSYQNGDSVAFDLKWITAPDDNGVDFYEDAVYYFEIPANAGEYALGSVAGEDGAYLFYLDIAANNIAKMSWISTITESTIVKTYAYPLGVDIVENPGDDIGITPSATIRLPAVAGGADVSISRVKDEVNETDTVYCTGPPGTGSTYTAALAIDDPENAEFDPEAPPVIRSSLAYMTGETDGQGAVFTTEDAEDITSGNQYIVASITLLTGSPDNTGDPIIPEPVRTDITEVITEEEVDPQGAQNQPNAVMSLRDNSAAAVMKAPAKELPASKTGKANIMSAGVMSGGAMSVGVMSGGVQNITPLKIAAYEAPPADAEYIWTKLSDLSLVTWVQEKSNAQQLRDVLGNPRSEACRSLYARVNEIWDTSLFDEVYGRLDDLLFNNIEWGMQQKTDDSDEAFCMWVLDPVHEETIYSILLDYESSAYAELFARLGRVVNDRLYFEVFHYLQQLSIVEADAPEEMTDEEFVSLLYDDEWLDYLMEILEDPLSDEYAELFELLDQIENAELKQAAEARIQEICELIGPLDPWASMSDEEFAAMLTDEANAESLADILSVQSGEDYQRLIRRIIAVNDAALKEQLEARIEELCAASLPDGEPDAPPDDEPDAPPDDEPDAPPDGEPDTPPDGEPDLPPDDEPDAPPDDEPDAPPDDEPGTPPDGEPDAPPDDEPDAPPDDEPDAPPDDEPDAPPDGDPDLPPDSVPDAPPDDEPGTPPDDEPDAPPDDEPDAPPDDEPDAPPDGEPDAPPDGVPDAPPDGEPDAPPDGEPDAPPDDEPDAPPDGEPGTPPDDEPDAPTDDEPDAPPDSVPDAPPDDEPDAPPDDEPDAPPDDEPDAPPDGEPDAPPDGVPDAPPDGEPDAPPDGEPDAPPDDEPDAPPDGILDAGL